MRQTWVPVYIRGFHSVSLSLSSHQTSFPDFKDCWCSTTSGSQVMHRQWPSIFCSSSSHNFVNSNLYSKSLISFHSQGAYLLNKTVIKETGKGRKSVKREWSNTLLLWLTRAQSHWRLGANTKHILELFHSSREGAEIFSHLLLSITG